jgi:hypothetical protein
MLLDPIKVISYLKFKFAIDLCPKQPNKRHMNKVLFKEKNNLTTSQGKPIFSSFHIFKHYMSEEMWNRGA